MVSITPGTANPAGSPKVKDLAQKTPQGLDIPVPKRGEVMGNLEKAAEGPSPDSSAKK